MSEIKRNREAGKAKNHLTSGRIEREKRTIEAMIRLYCSDQHATSNKICENCDHLLSYAKRRLDSCPFQAKKPACNNCQVHCYSKAMQREIQQVMRYAGPKMLIRYPLLSLWHLMDTFRKAPSLAKKSKREV